MCVYMPASSAAAGAAGAAGAAAAAMASLTGLRSHFQHFSSPDIKKTYKFLLSQSFVVWKGLVHVKYLWWKLVPFLS